MRNDNFPWDLWTLAEKLVGHGYDCALIQIREDLRPLDEGERFTGWVEVDPVTPMPDERRNALYALRHDSQVKGHTRDEVVGTLTRKLRQMITQRAIRDFQSAVPHEVARQLNDFAALLLGVNHRVYLGSLSSTPESMAFELMGRNHWVTVQGHVKSIREEIFDGHIKDEDDFNAAIDQIEVIYAREAMCILCASSNDEAWKDCYGDNESFPGWETAATFALQADVREELFRYGIVSIEITQKACARCGDVTVRDEDEENCPKCELGFDVEECEGFVDPTGAIHVCETCYENAEGADTFALYKGIEASQEVFDCEECEGTFIAPKKTAPEPAPEPTPNQEAADDNSGDDDDDA